MRTRRYGLAVFSTFMGLIMATPKASLNAAELSTVRVLLIQGTQTIPVVVLEERIAAKHNFKVIPEMIASVQALYTRMQAGNFDVGFGSFLTVSILRAQGYKLKQIYSLSDMSATRLIVLKESPIQGYGDLKGKKIGIFGGPVATTTYMLRLICQRFYGFDPLKQSKLQFGAPPLLVGMVEKKELDVILILEPTTTQMMETGKYRLLPTLGEFWSEKTGERPLLQTMVASEDWLNKNEEVAKRFVRALKESIEFVQKNREVWPGIVKKMGVATEEGQKGIYDRVAQTYITRWDRVYIDEQIKFVADLRQTFGGKLEGVPETVPEEGLSFKYVP